MSLINCEGNLILIQRSKCAISSNAYSTQGTIFIIKDAKLLVPVKRFPYRTLQIHLKNETMVLK